MIASVHVLHASPPEIGGFLRIGHTGHRKLEALLAANRLYFRRFVFDAAHIAEQIELVKSLRGITQAAFQGWPQPLLELLAE
jgi:hypothetical protein